jgi:two-component system, OmpR family, response regulator MtrA
LVVVVARLFTERTQVVAGTPIIIADGDPDILELVSQELSTRGYEVATAADGLQALEAVRTLRPAAAVLDWVMPMLQGPSACVRLKADPETADIPVVLLTARAAEEDIETAFRVGADDYLTKPFAIDELDDVLRRLTGRA